MFVAEAPAPADSPFDELQDLPLEQLEDELCRLAAQINAGMARWLRLVAECDRREAWGNTGCRSCAEWIAWRCSLSPRAAREHVRVARALGELPLTRRAFERGSLSYAKARVLTRVAKPESEAKLLELAEHATASQLERMLAAYRRYSTEDAVEAHEARYVSWHFDDDGSLCLNARLPGEQGALLLAALEASREALFAEQSGEERGPAGPPGQIEQEREHPRPTNADALCAMAETALARPPTALPAAERHQIVLHVDIDALAHDARGRVWLRDGPALSPETARRLACDASVVTLVEKDGEPLSVGRRTRAIPPAVRRALDSRDRGCRFPGCDNRRWVDAHHIRHWAAGGETGLDNLVLLCRHHHHLLHEGGFEVERLAGDELVFRRPDGRAIPRSPRLPPVPPVPERALPAAGPLLTGTGERMDLRACVDAVFAACEPALPST
jgi:Domain of unknown function (DUF222)/HNH endonuclease